MYSSEQYILRVVVFGCWGSALIWGSLFLLITGGTNLLSPEVPLVLVSSAFGLSLVLAILGIFVTLPTWTLFAYVIVSFAWVVVPDFTVGYSRYLHVVLTIAVISLVVSMSGQHVIQYVRWTVIILLATPSVLLITGTLFGWLLDPWDRAI